MYWETLLGERLGAPRPRPEDWWHAVAEVTTDVVADLGRDVGELAGMAITSAAPTFCLLWADDTASDDAVFYYDSPVTDAGAQFTAMSLSSMREERASRLFATAAKWFPVHADPPAEALLSMNGYVAYRLTGRKSLDAVTATMLDWTSWPTSDIRRAWFQELVPPISAPVDIIGVTKPSVAARLGLPAGLPVCAGAPDFIASALGSGAWGAGDATWYYGTFGCVLLLRVSLARLLTSRAASIDSYVVPVSLPMLGRQLRAMAVSSAGAAVADSLKRLDVLVATSSPGAGGVSYIPSDVAHPRSPRTFNGNDQTDRARDAHSVRAVYESFGYVLRSSMEQSADGAPTWSRSVFAAGGGARSEAWRQIVSDITGVAQRFDESSVGAGGSAVLALLAHQSTAGREMLTPVRARGRVIPDLAEREAYERGYARFTEARAAFVEGGRSRPQWSR
jgi:xylulokinase